LLTSRKPLAIESYAKIVGLLIRAGKLPSANIFFKREHEIADLVKTYQRERKKKKKKRKLFHNYFVKKF
jgi:hypothetical protein